MDEPLTIEAEQESATTTPRPHNSPATQGGRSLEASPAAKPTGFIALRSAVSVRPSHAHRELRAVLGPLAVSRVLLVALTAISAAVQHKSALAIWNQWDSRWYVGIAEHGYHWSLDGKPALAFYPAFPFLVHLGSVIHIPPILSGLLVSTPAFAGALLYLYRLVELEWGDSAAHRATWLFALFPTAFFTFAPYTESLWLLCATGAIFHARRGNPLRAGLWVAVAVLTRSTGLLLLPAMLIMLRPRRVWYWVSSLGPTVCAVVAYGVYLASQGLSLAQVFGAQRAWHRGLTFPWTGFTASLDWLARHATQHPEWAVENLLQMGVTILFLCLTVAAARAGDPGLKAYYAGFWLVILTSPEWLDGFYAPLNSVDRLILALFPLAGWAAARISSTGFRLWLWASGSLMIGAAGVHLAGGWVG